MPPLPMTGYQGPCVSPSWYPPPPPPAPVLSSRLTSSPCVSAAGRGAGCLVLVHPQHPAQGLTMQITVTGCAGQELSVGPRMRFRWFPAPSPLAKANEEVDCRYLPVPIGMNSTSPFPSKMEKPVSTRDFVLSLHRGQPSNSFRVGSRTKHSPTCFSCWKGALRRHTRERGSGAAALEEEPELFSPKAAALEVRS